MPGAHRRWTHQRVPRRSSFTRDLCAACARSHRCVLHQFHEITRKDVMSRPQNNVNTMACAAMAGHTLGFDHTIARLIADRRLTTHEVARVRVGRTRQAGLGG